MKVSSNIKISKNKVGLEFIEINNDKADARIALQGAHVDWWKPKSIKDDVLWLSSNARYEKEGQSEVEYRSAGLGLVSIQLIIVFAYMDSRELSPGN